MAIPNSHASRAMRRQKDRMELCSLPDPTPYFQLMEQIGKGSYGQVFKGRSLQTNEAVAIKLIPFHESEASEIKAEIDALRETNHPNIIKYLGTFFKETNLWVSLKQLCHRYFSSRLSSSVLCLLMFFFVLCRL
jgi:serine/threonine protein kinase